LLRPHFSPLAPLLCAAALATTSCVPLLTGDDTDLAGQEVRLTILHTSDIHSRLVPFEFNPLRTDEDLGLIRDAAPFGGAARMASILKQQRKAADRVLHLDSGDCFQGAPVYNTRHGEAEFRFLTRARLDAAVVGNHEFDSGALSFTRMARDHAQFPLLAANYDWEDHREPASNQTQLYTQPYSLHNVKGVRVAVVGMANISSLNSIVEGGNSLQATPLEQNEVARAYVDMLRPVVDVIMVTSHLGLHEDQDLVQGYDAYYKFSRARPFIERKQHTWKVLEWYGPPGEPESVVRVQIPGVSGIDVVVGGHLHVVLNPPQLLTDPSGRKVVLAHSGAFAKYVGRLDVVVRMPAVRGLAEGAEVLSHDYRVFPVDALWCDDGMRQLYRSKFWGPGEFGNDERVKAARKKCTALEDGDTHDLLQPYILEMDALLRLNTIFSYAPRDVARRNNSTGGDSPLGNMASDSIRKRARVEAEVALTNSLGIRDNIYKGPITEEGMFNVFPFENTINIMYLSGREMQELFDFVTERSAGRGCTSQAQISGARFVMDCAQAQLNQIRYSCDLKKTGDQNGSDCPTENREGRNPWQCLEDGSGTGAGRCWAHPALDIRINGQPISPGGTYKIAVNDYIAKGGSGFAVLKRNTTRIETGISLRDSLVGYMQGFCTCKDINQGFEYSAAGVDCGIRVDGKVVVDDQVVSYCKAAAAYEQELSRPAGSLKGCTCREALRGNELACGTIDEGMIQGCLGLPGPDLGTCHCRDVLRGDLEKCGTITNPLRQFCSRPTEMSVAVGYEDGRIGRRVK
jgi:5'-nucleotidase/UDP-sugar diphosphatase